MDEKKRDTVFGVLLFLLAAYIVAESFLMIGRAAGPPLRIDRFAISPGMFPLVLGGLLAAFAALLVFNSLRGEVAPCRILAERLKAAFAASRSVFGNDDFVTMLIGVALMFVYCFFVIGNIPFWSGAVGFLLVMMSFLRLAGPAMRFVRAANLGVIVLTAVVSASLIVFLFENIFGTILP
jgi:hypothetical protein